jgi:16S rRNA (guanine527-N7)-methyltransferase
MARALSLAEQLSVGLQALRLTLSPRVQQQLLDYVALLHKWNRVYNLTAVREPAEMVTRHILDSLAIWPYVQGQRVLDVGTGAGLPGIPLAIVSQESSPQREFVLLDSNSKKTRFVQQAVVELGLPNVQVVQARTEDWQATQSFDTVVSRAFAAVADMLANSGRHCASDGIILAMKGADPAAELAELGSDYAVEAVHRLAVPGLGEERHLVCLRPAG